MLSELRMAQHQSEPASVLGFLWCWNTDSRAPLVSSLKGQLWVNQPKSYTPSGGADDGFGPSVLASSP